MAKWLLKEKQGIKYFELDFKEPGRANLIGLFFTRVGGLKFTIKDKNKFLSDINWIKENFNLKNIYYLKQTHSDKIYYMPNDDIGGCANFGDGLYANQPNIFLSVRVADCLPIYFIVPDRKIVALVHSGWRGTLKEIGLKIVNTLQKNYKIKPEQISYVFGPSIGKCCYEIKEDFAKKFKMLIKKHKINNAVIKHDKKIFLDLKLINEKLLENIRLNKIADINLCSYCNGELFYSARRGNRQERNLALIGFKS